MLKTLRIRHFAIIEDLTVEFGPGFNVLTGETGAGKSIVVDSLGLAAGDRGDSSKVREGAERAVIEAAFDLPAATPVRAVLAGRGLDSDGEEIVARREIGAEGTGRVFINGSPCPLAVLREVGDWLVELHGQHEHQSLLLPERQQEVLDQYGGHMDALDSLGVAHRAVLEARERLERLQASASAGKARADELGRQVREIDAASPAPGEYDALERERRVLQHSGRLAQLLDEVVGLLYDGEPGACSLVAAASRKAAELAEIDSSQADLAARVEAARVELQDIGASLRDYRDGAEFDPSRLEAIEARRARLERLRLRYGADESAILRFRDEAARELSALENLESETERAGAAIAEAESRFVEAASILTRARERAAGQLGPSVEGQLRAVALGRARFVVQLASAKGAPVRTNAGETVPLSPRGAERVEFLFSANPGEAPRPLQRVASGGELSRLMLALHVVLEAAGSTRVLVFDEVDAGVGGAVADAVGSRLARLGKRHQVLGVTHLPQVAAHAERHYHVRKRVVGGRPRVEVSWLDEAARVDELARMLGGREITAASRRNAAELLAAASGTARSRTSSR